MLHDTLSDQAGLKYIGCRNEQSASYAAGDHRARARVRSCRDNVETPPDPFIIMRIS